MLKSTTFKPMLPLSCSWRTELSIFGFCSSPGPSKCIFITGDCSVPVCFTTELNSQPHALRTFRKYCWTTESGFKAINLLVSNPSWLFLKESPSCYPRSLPLPTNLLSAAFYVGIQTLFCIRYSCKYCCLPLCFFLCTDSQILLLACLTYHVSFLYYFLLQVQITGPRHFQRARKVEWSFYWGFGVPTDFKVLSLVFILKCLCVQLCRKSFYL